MKRYIIFVLLIVLFVTGCGNKDNVEDNNSDTGNIWDEESGTPKDASKYRTCAVDDGEGMATTYSFVVKNNLVEKVEIKRIYQAKLFGINSFTELDEENIEIAKDSFISDIGISENSSGVVYNIIVKNNLVLELNIDVSKVDSVILDLFDLSGLNSKTNYGEYITSFRKDFNAICK